MFRPDAPQPLGLGLPPALASASSASRRLFRHSRDASLWHSAHQELRPSLQRGLERNSENASRSRTCGNSSSSVLFHADPRGKQAWGVRGRPLKKRPSILTSLRVRVPMTHSTQRREVRALIRSSILRSDDVVTDKALGLTTLRAAVAVSLLHRRCPLLPLALVQRRTG